jgi:nucleoside-diphosphate-sugar epimerase
VLLTGGTGFIGNRLARRLVEEGHQTHLLVRRKTSLAALGHSRRHLKIHRAAESYAGIKAAVEKAKPDVVFHLASLFLAQHRPYDIRPLIEANILLGAELVEAMTATGCSRLVFAGTSWQHFQDAEYDPVCLYAATKQAFEALVKYWVAVSPLKAIALKVFDTYGPSDPRKKLISLLTDLALTGSVAEFSPGDQFVDLVHVDDVVEAFLAAERRTRLQPAGTLESYAVTSGAPRRLRELVERFEAVSGRRLKIKWGARAYRPREVMVPWRHGVPVPGWQPTISLEEGFRGLITGPVQKD